jgi:hypothetical protein
MDRKYIAPTVELCAFVFERGYDLSTSIGGWEGGGESSGDAE